MKKRWKRAAAAFFLIVSVWFPVSAAEKGPADGLNEQQLLQSGYYSLLDQLPEGVESVDSEAFEESSFSDWVHKGIELIREKAAAPLRLSGKLLGTVLVTALLSAWESEKASGVKLASNLALAAVTGRVLIDSAEGAVKLIENVTRFMTAFLPVFAAAAGASGKPASSAVWYGVTLGAIELFSASVGKIVLPLTMIFTAVGISCTAAPELGGSALMKPVRNTALGVLSLFLTLFLAGLTVKTGVRGITDGDAVKTAKFLLGSTVPVVGSAIGDAWSALSGCLSVVKGTIGVFGILVIGAVFLPQLTSLLLTMAAFSAAGAAAEMLGEKTASELIRTGESALSILAAVLICCGLMLSGAVAMVLLAGSG